MPSRSKPLRAGSKTPSTIIMMIRRSLPLVHQPSYGETLSPLATAKVVVTHDPQCKAGHTTIIWAIYDDNYHRK
ncbi:hypothetical protein L484_020244 [Morus notabilis]|uniref:Uncharacterized protein n=1 Tax=Morus notabilis TaxID=981085 RepID=W9RM82_9ROSA|nr:hypothetical protein L484_020244 [Morus notabilis]